VILPAYNEKDNLLKNVPLAIRSLGQMVGRFELILIDDCSTDDTAAAVDQLAAEHPEIRGIHNPHNLRQGGCLRVGFELASLPWVTHNAADYPFHYDDLPPLLERLPQADIVVVSRKTYPGTSAPRRFVSFVNRSLLQVLFGTPIRDYNFVQIYRRDLLRELPTVSTATSFITPETIIRAYRRGYRVIEIEADCHLRVAGQSTSANVKNIRRALVDMARLRLELFKKS